MDRRDFLKIGSGLAALVAGAACNISSNGGNGPDPDPDPSVPYYFGLYDNFEGGWKSNLWRGSADIVNDNGNNVAKIVKEGSGTRNITMNWPCDIPVEHFQEWSARVKLSSESTAESGNAQLDYHGVDPGGLSWYTQIKIRKEPAGVYIVAQCTNRVTDYNWSQLLKETQLDKWHDLKITMDISNNSLLIKYFVDGTERAELVPPDSQKLIDHEISGLHRNLGIYIPSNRTGKIIGYFDDVYGVMGDEPAAYFQQLQMQRMNDLEPDGFQRFLPDAEGRLKLHDLEQRDQFLRKERIREMQEGTKIKK